VFKVSSCTVTFSKEITRDFIQKAQKAYNTQANDLLLTALVQAIGEYSGYQLCLDLEGHGRETLDSNLDLTKTIGWFTSVYPVYIKLSEPANLDKSIKEVKEQLRQVPEKGITYGIATSIRKQVLAVQTKIVFNYLGQWDSTDVEGNAFKLGNDCTGQCSGVTNGLSHNIEINGQIQDGILSFIWTFNYQKAIIEKVINDFKEKLEALITHCSRDGTCGYTPSDFAITDTNQQELDDIFKILNK
jgi:non-ribosomal peptide synthase protein (TIGR01720 family)